MNETELASWLRGYQRAWETRDADLAASLFSADASYRETPFDDPLEGREAIRQYWARVTADQADIGFHFDVISLSGRTGIAAWSARFRSIPAEATVELRGVFVLEFADAKTVQSLREWWHVR